MAEPCLGDVEALALDALRRLREMSRMLSPEGVEEERDIRISLGLPVDDEEVLQRAVAQRATVVLHSAVWRMADAGALLRAIIAEFGIQRGIGLDVMTGRGAVLPTARAPFDELMHSLKSGNPWLGRPPADTPSAMPGPQPADPEQVVADLDASIPHPAPQ